MLYTKLMIKLFRTFGLLVGCSIPGLGAYMLPITVSSYFDTMLTSLNIFAKSIQTLG